jgi:hypothetical protein
MKAQTEISQIPWETTLRYDAFVIGLYVFVFIAGLGLKTWVENEPITFTDRVTNLSLSYPSSWSPTREKGTLLSVRDLHGEGIFKAIFSVKVKELDLTEGTTIQDLIQPFTEERSQDLNYYRILKISDTEVDSLGGVTVTYGYVYDPVASSLQTYLPTIVRGVDTLVIRGNSLYIFSFAAPETSFSQYSGTLDSILQSVDFDLEDLYEDE